MKRQLLAVPALVVSLGALTACGVSAPPAKELADELINTLEVSDEVKDCMHEVVTDFGLTEDDAQGFENLDDVAAKAADGQERAIQIMDAFQQSLAECN